MSGDITPNELFAILVLYTLAVACCGAAIAFGIIERQARKAQRNTKHTPINIKA